MKTLYDKVPKIIGQFQVNVEEYFHYTYLPIKLAGQDKPVYEERLRVFDKIIGAALCDFIGDFGLDRYVNSYVYLTAKHQYQRGGQAFNRSGLHSDGFGSSDVSYIWSNKQPTIFNYSKFMLSPDDSLSMREMEEQADPEKNYHFGNNALLRMDQYSIHRVGEPEEGNRAFVKICFSEDKYNLKGNSKNYLLDYDWEYFDRKKERNIPQNK